MKCLFINTAEGTRVLLKTDEATFYDENMSNAGSETLLPMIDSILKKANLKISDLDVFGACVGPGSFTGLRIGLTTVKTFCYSLDKQCFAVNNLRLNSYKSNGDKVISIADAGNKVCYIARYDGDKELDPPKCVALDDAKKYVADHSDFAVATDGKLCAVFSGVSGVGETEMLVALDKHIAEASEQKELAPLYIRKAQPERGKGDL